MPSPKDIEEKMRQMLNAWKTLAPSKSFGGMTVEDFEALIKPALDERAHIAELEAETIQAKARRDQHDANFNAKAKQAVAGVVADPDLGPNSALYEAWGYTPDRDRKTGLHRNKHKEPDTK
jgi:hypothetical protein